MRNYGTDGIFVERAELSMLAALLQRECGACCLDDELDMRAVVACVENWVNDLQFAADPATDPGETPAETMP